MSKETISLCREYYFHVCRPLGMPVHLHLVVKGMNPQPPFWDKVDFLKFTRYIINSGGISGIDITLVEQGLSLLEDVPERARGYDVTYAVRMWQCFYFLRYGKPFYRYDGAIHPLVCDFAKPLPPHPLSTGQDLMYRHCVPLGFDLKPLPDLP